MMSSAEVNSPEAAKVAAESFLDAHIRPTLEHEVITTEVLEYGTCWVVGWNSRAYVEDGDISSALAGGGPVIVNRRTGVVRMGSSAMPAQDQLDPE